GLSGVEFVVSDDHAGLNKAISEVLSEAVWQRCYVHFLRNALDYLPRKADDEVFKACRLGRVEHRRDADLLPPAAPTSQAHEEHQHARTAQRGDQTTHPCRAHLPQYRIAP